VCKLIKKKKKKKKKTLYGLKKAPKDWYSRLDKYLQKIFKRGISKNNLHIKTTKEN
jgi:hypothetical protein